MKADLHTLKKELRRLTDTIKKFDVSRNLNSQARTQISHLEKRFKDLLQSLSDLQKQVDLNLEKIIHAVRREPNGSLANSKKTSRKTAPTGSKAKKKSTTKPSISKVKSRAEKRPRAKVNGH